MNISVRQTVLALVCFLAVVFALCGCGPAENALVGEYSDKEGGKSCIRIDHNGGQYSIALKQGDKWSDSANLVPILQADKDAISKDAGATANLIGLKSADNQFMIFKVPPGTTIERKTFHTGYYIIGGIFLAGELHKL